MHRPHGLFALPSANFDLIYGEALCREIQSLADIAPRPYGPEVWQKDTSLLAPVEVLFSGWGGPRIDAAFLAAAPKLKVVFYGSGSLQGTATPAAWNAGIRFTSAYAANGQPVAEFTLAAIIFGLKQVWPLTLDIKRAGAYPSRKTIPGCYDTTVGIISMGVIARHLCRLLKAFDMRQIVYDPFLSPAEAAELGVRQVSLPELFAQSDVVTLHTPWLPETENMITREHLAAMKSGSTFINTARGAVVDEADLLAVATDRPDIQFFLDVTHPEPPVAGSPLYTLPNVILTPHIAGSIDGECRRMGRYMVDELRRWIAGQPLQWEITAKNAAHSSHRPPAA